MVKKIKEKYKEKKTAFAKICIFMGAITLPMLVWGILKCANIFNPGIMQELDYDLGEKRQKSEFPDTFNLKTITTELENYYNDRVPFRSAIITANRGLYNAIEKPYDEAVGPFLVKLIYGNDDVKLSDNSTDKDLDEFFGDGSQTGDNSQDASEKCEHKYEVVSTVEPDYEWGGYTLYECSLCGENKKSDFTDKLIDNSYMPPKVFNGATLEGRMNWLFYVGNNTLEYYQGTNILDEDTMAEWLDAMERLQAVCDEKGIQLLYMIMPAKEQAYSEYMPTYTIENTYKRVPRFVDYVKNNSDLNIIYPLEELLAAKKYWQVYYRHDTHWNNAGGFIGVQAILKALGKPTADFSDITFTSREWEIGDLINIGNLDDSLYNGDIEYDIEYKPEISAIWTEGNEETIYYVKSDSTNNEKLVVIGDSFRKHLSRFIYKDFAESAFSHRDCLDDAKLQESIRNTDVLIVSATERYDYCLVESVEEIISILSE